MRVLFATRPFLGHLFPMVPLARAVQDLGHEAVVASCASVRAAVQGAGLTFCPAGHDPAGPLPGSDRGQDRDYGREALRRKASDLLAGPPADVVLRDPTDLAAGLVADVWQVPHVVLGRSHFLPRETWRELAGDAVQDVRRGLGLAPDPALDRLFGALYLDAVPAWFHPSPPPAAPLLRMAADAYDGPPTPVRLPEPPFVYVTLGTVYDGDLRFFRVALAAVHRLGLRALVTTTLDPSALGAGPDDVVASYVPQSAVLPHAAAVMCHGGFSTVLGALLAGLPVVCVPRGSDQEGNAARVQRLGAGVWTTPAQWSEQTATEALAAVLDGPHRGVAADLAARTADPPVAAAARLVTELPGLLARGEDLAARLRVLHGRRTPAQPDASGTGYRSRNAIAWERLSRAGSDSSRPLPPLPPEAARRRLDADGWLPWRQLRTVLCLAGGGGQQGPLFAGLGCEVTVVDLAEEQLSRDREAARRVGRTLETVAADMCDLSVLGSRTFDLVYQPVSTCYVPDLAVLYGQVAGRVRPGGWYWSEHYSALHLQLDPQTPWDGTAYRVSRPLADGTAVPWSVPLPDGAAEGLHFMHPTGDLLGRMCDAGFAIQRVAEPPAATPGAAAGEPGHLAGYLPPFIRVLARRYLV